VADLDHVGDMVGGLGVARGPFDSEGIDGLHEAVNVAAGEFGKRDACLVGTLDGIVVKISEVHVGINRQSLALQIAGDQVGDDETAAQ